MGSIFVGTYVGVFGLVVWPFVPGRVADGAVGAALVAGLAATVATLAFGARW